MIKKGISLLAVAVASPAFAQAGDVGPDASAVGADIIVTASRVIEEAREIGSAVTVIDRAELQRNQITFAKDALLYVPGAVLSTDRPGNITTVNLRGSGNEDVLWLIDGIELGDPSLISTAYQSDHLTSQDIARIEVLRGNQSSLYGSDAIGGVINILTQRATEDGVKINAEGEAGSYSTVNGGASVLGKSGPLDFRLTATGYRHNGPSLSDPRTAGSAANASEKDEYWRYGFSGRLGYQLTDSLAVQAIGFWQDSFSDVDGSDFSGRVVDGNDTAKNRQYAYAGQANYRSLDGHLKVDLTGSRYVSRRLYFGLYNSADGDLYRGTKDELSLAVAYDGLGPVSLAVGGNYEWEKSRQYTAFSGGFRAKVDTKSVYGEVALRPVDGLTITGAARVDDNSRFGSFDTYRGTFAYALGGLKLRASYGTGAKAPGLYQLFDPSYGNPNLKAQTSRGGDVGFDLELAEGLSTQVSYFFNRKKNEINWDSSRLPYGGYGQYGRSRTSGVEVAVKAQPLPWLGLTQTYTYADHEADKSVAGNGAFVNSGRPQYSASSSVVVTPVEQASFTARVRYRDGNEEGFGGVTQPFTVVDLLGSYRINDGIEVYGRVLNLFDKWYQMSYGTQTLGLSAYGGVRVTF